MRKSELIAVPSNSVNMNAAKHHHTSNSSSSSSNLHHTNAINSVNKHPIPINTASNATKVVPQPNQHMHYPVTGNTINDDQIGWKKVI